ncbi:hypothetical protein GF312_01615 [Candidatus Poribacteria bacterium]|nr:hypothetical protein [Candidatus Poribacteria bacterium]
MSWHVKELVYEARSPVHIGFHNLGMIQRTRFYIPGKVIWGATTSRLTRLVYRNPTSKNYEKVGKYLKENVIFTYLFPSLDGVEAYIPSYSNGYGYETSSNWTPQEELEHQLISSYGSTAMEPSSGSAEVGSLHDTELLISTPKGSSDSLKFLGYVFWQTQKLSINGIYAVSTYDDLKFLGNNGEVSFFSQVMSNIQVGGGRSYGYGDLYNDPDAQILKIDNPLWNRFNISLSDTDIQVTLTDKLPIPGHVIAKSHHIQMDGGIEPMVGRDWDNAKGKGAGRSTSFRGVGFVPGSIIRGEDINVQMCFDGVMEY